MLLQFLPDIQALAQVTTSPKPPLGLRYWQNAPCLINTYQGNYIHTQVATGGFCQLSRYHIHTATAYRLVAMVSEPTMAIGFIHKGGAIGKLSGVGNTIEFQTGHYFITVLMPGNNKAILELEAGKHEITVILIEKKFETTFLKMFTQLTEDVEDIQNGDRTGLAYPPYPITPAMGDLLDQITRYTGSTSELPAAINHSASGLILIIKKILDGYAAIDEEAARIKMYLTCRLNETLTAASVAKDLGITRPQLFDKVKQHFGITFKNLLTETRMERARQLLSDPNWKIRAISEELGYKNEGHFSNAFLKNAGMRPSEYRKRNK